jgi:hypothetical protein
MATNDQQTTEIDVFLPHDSSKAMETSISIPQQSNTQRAQSATDDSLASVVSAGICLIIMLVFAIVFLVLWSIQVFAR